MNEYKEAVEILASKYLDNEFTNRGKSHAAIVLTNMMRTTENSFLIYTGSFNTEVCEDPEFMKALEKLIQSEKTLHVFIETLPNKPERSKALTKVLNASDNHKNVEIKLAPKAFINELQERLVNGNLHFAVSDNRAFRLEVEPENFKAVCNFNDSSIASRFTELFTKYFSSEKALDSGS